MSNSQIIKTVADTYRDMNSVQQNSSLTEATFSGDGREPSAAVHAIAAHVSRLANDSKNDPKLHQLASDIHSHIAYYHTSPTYADQHWADANIGAKHLKLAAKHAKHF